MKTYIPIVLFLLISSKAQESFNVAFPITLSEENIETVLPLNQKKVYGIFSYNKS